MEELDIKFQIILFSLYVIYYYEKYFLTISHYICIIPTFKIKYPFPPNCWTSSITQFLCRSCSTLYQRSEYSHASTNGISETLWFTDWIQPRSQSVGKILKNWKYVMYKIFIVIGFQISNADKDISPLREECPSLPSKISEI